LTVDQQAGGRREFAAPALNELGLENSDAHCLHDVITEHRLKSGTRAWTKQTERWPEQSRRALREQYGPAEAERLQAQLRTLIDARPALAKTLAGGLAGHPDVVQMLVGPVRRASRHELRAPRLP
jgi:hypothetical protein